jgi:hypothetical protein
MNTGQKAMNEGVKKITPNMIWESFTKDERAQACEAVWTVKDENLNPKEDREKVDMILAKQFKSRLTFFRKKTAPEKGRLLHQYATNQMTDKLCSDLVKCFILNTNRSILGDFLDAQGIAHEKGNIKGEVNKLAGTGSLRKGITKIEAKYSKKEVAVYLGFLITVDLFKNLGKASEIEGINYFERLTPQKIEETLEESDEVKPEKNQIYGPSFTQLDDILIKTIIATSNNNIGALKPIELEILITEILELNATRQKTHFHMGLYHSEFCITPKFKFPGSNEERRLWYFTGYLEGLLRTGEPAMCVDYIIENNELADALIKRSDLPCGKMLYPLLIQPFFDKQKYALLGRWATYIDLDSPRKQIEVLQELHRLGAQLLREGKGKPAKTLLDVVQHSLNESTDLPNEFVNWLENKNKRKQAQYCQLSGDFNTAKKLFNALIEKKNETTSNLRSDMGLVMGAFKTLRAVIPVSASKVNSIKENLSKGKKWFQSDIEYNENDATNSNFCLGVLELLERSDKSTEKVVTHLENAYSGMSQESEAYESTGILNWVNFLYGLALIETLQEENYIIAQDRFSDAINIEYEFPLWLWERALESSSAYSDLDLAVTIAGYLLECRNKSESFIWDSGLAKRNTLIREPYLEWLINNEMPVSKKWKLLDELREITIEDNEYTQTQHVLDSMDKIAGESDKHRDMFVLSLYNDDYWSPAWSDDDVSLCLTNLYELDGDLDSAFEVQQKLFYKFKNQGDEWNLSCARNILDYMEKFKSKQEEIKRLAEQLPEEKGLIQELDYSKVSLIYINGNEQQAKYKTSVMKHFVDNCPGLQVDFKFPGWSSNWNKHIDELKPILSGYSAVILGRMIRTGMGKQIRKLCDANTPWSPCTGTGKKSMITAIQRAAKWAASN